MAPDAPLFPAPGVRYLRLPITGDLAGQEVNSILRRRLGLSGTLLRRVKQLPDGITLDGVRVTVRAAAAPGQVLAVRLSDPDSRAQPAPTPGVLDIVWEDADLAVVSKAPGMLVHPSHGHFDDTVGNYFMAHCRAAGECAGFHPIHRLDKGTSGLLLCAKHPYAQEKLRLALHTGCLRRRYLAVCDGLPHPPEGAVDAPIAMAPGSAVRRCVDPSGKPAVTHYRVLRAAGGRSLLELELQTGRTHQIRVHMAHIGCPLTGDFLYGAEAPGLIARPALHSARLDFIHPVTGQALSLSAPLPADMAALCPDGS